MRPLDTADPVAAFLAAHEAGSPVALATSGTTGSPRAVVRSTQSWVSSFGHVSALTGLDATSHVWVPGPLHATMNLFAAVHATFAGATWSSTPEGATHAQLTPALLARHVADLRGLNVVVAGDRLPAALRDEATAAGIAVCHYYGAAELSFVAWGSCADDLTPFPGAEVEVRDGEIWVRSPYLALGYDGQPGAQRLDAAGFATVGDRGAWDGSRLVVHGRDDVVTTGGATVLVADVERALRTGATGDVIVLGLPHASLGAVVAAAFTATEDGPRLRAAAAALEPAERPRIWLHVETLPRTDGGKVDREALVRLAGRRI